MLSSNCYGITLGIEDLDVRYRDILKFGATIVIVGKPGCGKTILASTICYKNALKGVKCLYISMNEFEDEFTYYMKKLNMDFTELSGKSFKFVSTSIPAGEEAVKDFIQQISELIAGFKPNVVVIDSINPLLRAIKSIERRAWVQNFFRSIPRIINGLLIFVAEDPG
ncbi:MAG: ATPase domain-containing protein, partial [Desulfurococcaceae archaeon]|nr:AAA family ATPase [Sulfolobales archaeon]MDW8169880.1 ATPase domain-containing protein [Desulfurococcaceae archaeon]